MSPLFINILLHIYSRPEQIEDLDYPAQQDCIRNMLLDDLIVINPAEVPELDHDFKITDKGIAFVKMICSTPQPVLLYIDPRKLHETKPKDCKQIPSSTTIRPTEIGKNPTGR